MILEKIDKYYSSNFEEIESFLGKTTFLKRSLNYPNSIVIKFGEKKVIGEISVWDFEHQKYIECEYADLTNLENEPISIIKTIKIENVIESLIEILDELRKVSNNNYR